MTGKIEMIFTEQNVSVCVDLQMKHGLADKCFVLDAVCEALRLEGLDKKMALAMVAIKEAESEGNKQ